jgi:uncharacterized membrane protein
VIDDKVKAVLLAAVIVMGLMTAGQYWLEHRVVEPFSELGVLGPDQLLGDYSSNVTAGQNVTLYGYIGNHEGAVTYYDLRVKLGNLTTVVNGTVWVDAPSVADFRAVLRDGQNSTFPVVLSFPQPANGTKIIFELWELDTSSGSFLYSGLWGQIILNVTAS